MAAVLPFFGLAVPAWRVFLGNGQLVVVGGLMDRWKVGW